MPQRRKPGSGLAAMSPEKKREIASKGGTAAHAFGTAHAWTSEEASKAGKKGGATTAKQRKDKAARRKSQ